MDTGYTARQDRSRIPAITFGLVAVVGITILLSSTALAQSTQGSITGTVADSSGAVIVGVTVGATNLRTNFTRQTVTNDRGVYEFPNLDPSEYTIKAELAGFKTYINEKIVLTIRDALRVDVRLELGEVTQQVTVEAEASVVRSEDAKLEVTFNRKYWETPSFQYHGYGMTALEAIRLPGVYYTRQFGEEGTAMMISGARSTETKTTVQGINQTSYGVYNVPTGAMEEMKVIRHGAPAEYPTASTVEMTIRGGTSDYHGEVAYDLRNTKLNATSYWAPIPPPVGTPSYALTYRIGGPVYIPKLYPHKNKTFFFFDRERNKRSDMVVPRLYSMPTSGMRAGNFNNLLIGGKPVNVVDPLTGQPFPNNTIPAERINAVSRKVLDLFPTPNTGNPNDPVLNLIADYPSFAGISTWALRIDHNLTDRQTLSFAWGSGNLPQRQDIAGGGTGGVPGLRSQVSENASDSPSLAWTWTINPRLVNELRIGGLRQYVNGSTGPLKLSGRGLEFINGLGIQGISPGVDALAMPSINIKEVQGIQSGAQSRTIKDYYHVIENASLQKGSHGFKFGVDVRVFQRNALSVSGDAYGSEDFTGRFTGLGFADFLLGVPDTTSLASPRPLYAGRYKELGFYFQDKWAVTPNVTVTYGLRNSLWTVPNDQRDLFFNFDPKTGNLVVPNDEALKYVHPQWPKNIPIVTAAQAGFPEKLRNLSYLNLAPRLAIAWRPFGHTKTAIRASYGIYHSPVTFDSLTPFTGGPFTVSQTFLNSFDSATKQFLFAWPRPIPPSVGPATAGLGSIAISAINPNADIIPYVQHFNLIIDHEIRKDTRISVGYVGSKATQLMYRRNINVPAPSTIAFDPTRRPYPLYNAINMADNGGNQTYHSMEAMLYRRFSNGFQFDGGWIWANALNDVGDSGTDLGPGIRNPFCRACDKGRQIDIVKHNFKGNFLWELPMGRGRPFLHNLNPFLNGIVGGWTISSIFEFRTGEFLTPVFTGRDLTNTGITSGVPDRTCDGNVTGAKDFRNKTADLSCFPIPAAGSGRFGNSGRGIIVGPNNKMWDGGIYKDFRITERVKFRFGAEALNAFRWIGFGYHNENITTPTGMEATWCGKGIVCGRQLEFRGKIDF